MAASRVWSGCSPREKEFILIFNGKSWFGMLVELEESCGLHCEQLCGLVFFTAIILFMRGKNLLFLPV